MCICFFVTRLNISLFSCQAHLIKALCNGGYVNQLIPLVENKDLQSEWWHTNRPEVLQLIPCEHREKFDEAHAIKSDFEMELVSETERQKYFKQSLGHLSRTLHSGMWQSEHFHALVDENDPAALDLLPLLTTQALRRSAETMQRVSEKTREARRSLNCPEPLGAGPCESRPLSHFTCYFLLCFICDESLALPC